MNEYEATIQINPTDDIKFILEEPGCYESEIEMMKAGGTYDAFVKRVYDAIDWSHLFERMHELAFPEYRFQRSTGSHES